MDDDTRTRELLSLANSAGYLLQLRVQHEIETSAAAAHGWTVPVIEHYWKHPDTGRHGYIDLVAAEQGLRLVVECKRVREADWVFLVPSYKTEVARLRCLWTARVQGKPNRIGWNDFQARTTSYESGFCVVRGHADRDRPMLERLADDLIPSVEALAFEETAIGDPPPDTHHRIYLPVLLTTARLQVCSYDAAKISLQSGDLPAAEFNEVPYLRFRKGLQAHVTTGQTPTDLPQASRERERSILVVNSLSLVEFLTKFDFRYTGKWPWT